jgi:beta-galactosidase GanA
VTTQNILGCISVCWLGLLAVPCSAQPDPGFPHLRKQGTATQFIVDGKPFVALTGEIEGDDATSLEGMKWMWPEFVKMNMNTILPVVYWEQFEPEEGKYDFTLVDGIIQEARRNHLRMCLVWFASFKNGLVSWAPLWVKKDYKRFPRAQIRGGKSIEYFSVAEGYGDATREADARAYAALMRHIKEVDGREHTVIFTHVENEVGMSGDSRDRSPGAEKAFAGPVPKALMDYLQKHKDTLIPEFRQVWEKAGSKTSGTWEEVFGKGAATDEIFMVWSYAQYVNRVTAAGKAEYPLPAYTNGWVTRTSSIAAVAAKGVEAETTGYQHSGDPMWDLLDVWRAGAPEIDFMAPDVYPEKDFAPVCTSYHQSWNPLYVGEAEGGPQGAAEVLWAVGHDAMGFSVYGVEYNLLRQDPQNELGRVYKTIEQLMPVIVEHQGKKGETTGVLLGESGQTDKARLGDYTLTAVINPNKTRPRGTTPAPLGVPLAGALFVLTAPDELYVINSNEYEVAVTFTPNTPGPPNVGVGIVEEGSFVDGKWVAGRRLDHRVTTVDPACWYCAPALLMPGGYKRRDMHSENGILRVKLYRYE